MLILAMAIALQADDAAIKAEGWARKAKPIISCAAGPECDEKWERAKAWVKANSRFQVAVDKPDLFATYGAVYANTDLSFVLSKRQLPNGRTEISARAWCGNVIACRPKPRDAVASLIRALG